MAQTTLKNTSEELLQHIKNINIEAQQWVKQDPENRQAPMLVENLEFWEECGVTDIDTFEKHGTVYAIQQLLLVLERQTPSEDELFGTELDKLHTIREELSEEISNKAKKELQEEIWSLYKKLNIDMTHIQYSDIMSVQELQQHKSEVAEQVLSHSNSFDFF